MPRAFSLTNALDDVRQEEGVPCSEHGLNLMRALLRTVILAYCLARSTGRGFYGKAGVARAYEEAIGPPEIEDYKMLDRKSTRLNSSHSDRSRMPSSA